ncbi:ParA family protein [Vibrio harveyi]
MPINLSRYANNIDIFKQEHEGFDEEIEKNLFRMFSRKDFYSACGVKDSTALSNKLPEIIRVLEENSDSPVSLGEQIGGTGPYYYSLKEVYEIIEACRILEQRAKKKSKYKVTQKYRRSRAHKTGIANQKGGAGKSTSALNIAIGQALKGFQQARVLLIDYDPQGNIQKFADGRYLNSYTTKTIFKYLMEEYDTEYSNEVERGDFVRKELIRSSLIPNLDYCPALTNDNAIEGYLNMLELSFDDEKYAGSNVYKIFKEKFLDHVEEYYDIIIIDAAPHNNTFIRALMYGIDHLVVPAPTKAMDCESTLNFMYSLNETFEKFKEELGHEGLKYLDILPVMYNGSDTARKIIAIYNSMFDTKVFPHPISFRTAYEVMSNDNCSTYNYKKSEMTDAITIALTEWEKFNDSIRLTIDKNK